MSKTYLPYEPDQHASGVAGVAAWRPSGLLHLRRGGPVGMSEVTARYERERRGGPPYHPRMMVKVLLYGYCVGVVLTPHRPASPRGHRLQGVGGRTTHRTSGPSPTFARIIWMRCRGLFVYWGRGGAGEAGARGVDGTKVKANASKHKAMSYQG